MANPSFVKYFTRPLDQLALPYMIVGSVASIIYGELRSTLDVDFIVAIAPSDATRLAAAFPLEEFYCPPVEVLGIEADRAHRGHFNIIHHDTGLKADFYIATADPLTQWALQRRRLTAMEGEKVWLAPPEYVIVGKLEFYREGGIEKHLRDIRVMLTSTPVDRALIEAEVARRGLTEPWLACQRRGV